METVIAEEISAIPKKMPTRHEILERIETVMDLLSSGYNSYQIWKATNWGVNLSAIQRYIKHCSKRVEKQHEKNFNKIRSWHIEKHKWIYKKFVEDKDWRGAIVALGRLEELQGLKDGQIFPLSPQEEEKRLNTIKQKLFQINPKLIQRPEGKSEFEVKNA